ncbi:MAG: hypothetical protein P4L92_15155 [Rudaea sp.]|nr:hypothetical protein [Rudaea sp.]
MSSLAELAESTSILDAWRDYALADLKPGFSWADDHSSPPAPPSLFDRGNAHFAPPASHFTGASNNSPPIQVAFIKSRVADTPLFIAAESSSLWQDSTPGIQRYVVAPSVSQRWGDNSAVSFSAIFAYQRFAGLGLGVDSVSVQDDTGFATGPYSLRGNVGSYGTGMRVDLNSAITDRLSWQVGYQSRVNMDAFNNYRGVYSEPGSFDIPASANIGLGYALTPELKMDAGVQRVMYSAIEPFTSDALPTRFLVLLGSEISPTFAWQNLSVYSLGVSWQDRTFGTWSLHLSSREQPLPTSPLLQNALEPYLSSHDIEFAFARAFGGNSSLRLAATYAPTQFVLGIPTSNSLRDAGNGNQIEYEAVWITRF